MYVIGIDIGGTKVSVSLATVEGHILESEKFATTSAGPPERDLQRVYAIVRKWQKEFSPIHRIGLSAPGPLNVEKGMLLLLPNLPGWHNFPVAHVIEKELKIPVNFNNDANAAVLAEWRFGACKGTKNLIYLTHSTGMGAGIIVDGKLVQGTSDTAGEVGHFVIDPNGVQCSCGQKGCFEAYVGGKAFAKRIQKILKQETIATSILVEANQDTDAISMRHIIPSIRQKDAFALKMWDEYMEHLAQGLSVLVMVLNPDAIVLGTIAHYAHDLVFPTLVEKMAKYCWKVPLESVRIESSTLPQIGDLGAIALALM